MQLKNNNNLPGFNLEIHYYKCFLLEKIQYLLQTLLAVTQIPY